jgi:hypothetical protein
MGLLAAVTKAHPSFLIVVAVASFVVPTLPYTCTCTSLLAVVSPACPYPFITAATVAAQACACPVWGLFTVVAAAAF